MIHRMPINFESEERTFPFKIFAKVKTEGGTEEGDSPEDKLYVAVEKLSILYDYFNDKIVTIKNIGEYLPSQTKNTSVYLFTNLTQKGTVITDAEIVLTNTTPQVEPDSQGYPVKIPVLLGSVILSNDGEISIFQSNGRNLTRLACGVLLSYIL